MFVPGHRDDLLVKAVRAGADCLFLDLEDGVPPSMKAAARLTTSRAIAGGLQGRMPLFVRINSLDTDFAFEDLEVTACEQLSGFVIPHVDEVRNLASLESILEGIEERLSLAQGYFSLMALIESPRAVLNAAEIASASPRMMALIFGCEDYLAALQGRHSDAEEALLTPRALVAMAARAAGLEAIDTPYVRVHDLEGLKRFATQGRDLGFCGMCALSPRQIPVIHEAYTPSEEEIRQAEEVIAAAERSQAEGRGVMISGGAFVSPPTVRAAKKLLERTEAIRQHHPALKDGAENRSKPPEGGSPDSGESHA